MLDSQIESLAGDMHQEIWRHRHSLWPLGHPDPISMLHPSVAAHVLGLEYLEIPNFNGQRFSVQKHGYKLAGEMDRSRKTIAVATDFGQPAARFTGAHEVGHFVMHPKHMLHRDRPLDGNPPDNSGLNREEREANIYAACLLMPRRMVQREFKARFGPYPLTFDSHLASNINPTEYDALVSTEKGDCLREFELAKCDHLGMSFFTSMAMQFRVSNPAMAYRLKELELVKWP